MQQVGLLPTSHSQQHELNEGPDSVSYLVCITILSKASRHISSVCKLISSGTRQNYSPHLSTPNARDATGTAAPLWAFSATADAAAQPKLSRGQNSSLSRLRDAH